MRTPICTLLFCALLALTACGEDATTPEPPGVDIELPASTVVAGEPVPVEGLTAGPELEGIRVEVNGEPALLMSNDDGEVRLLPPLSVDPDSMKWQARDDLDVVFRDAGGNVLAEFPGALSMTAPPPAPGTCERVLEVLEAQVDAIDVLLAALPAAPGIEEQAVVTFAPLLRSMLDPEQPHSLPAALEALSEEEIDLIDSLWASTGYPERVEVLTATLEEVAAGFQVGNKVLELDDEKLAQLMQSAVYAKRYAAWYVHGLAGDFSEVNTGVGFTAVFYRIPTVALVANIVNVTSALFDLVANKVLVALLPTKIDRIELNVVDDELEPGDYTSSTATIFASNDPPPITLNDFVAQILNVAGAIAPGNETALYDFVIQLVSTIVEQINNLLISYAETHPGFETRGEILSIPQIQFSAVLDSPLLVDPRSSDETVVVADRSIAEWQAQSKQDEASVWLIPSRREEDIAIRVDPLITYGAGTFGEDITASNRVRVEVRNPILLDLDLPPSVPANGLVAIEVRAYYEELDGTETPAANAAVTILATGGSVQEPTGSTDANGQYVTVGELSPGSALLELEFRVTDTLGNEATDEGDIPVLEDGGNVILESYRARVTSSVNINGYGTITASGFQDSFALTIPEPLPWDVSNSIERANTEGVSGSASCSGTANFFMSESGNLGRISVSGDSAAQLSVGSSAPGEIQSSGRFYVTTSFEVVGDAVSFEFTADFQGAGITEAYLRPDPGLEIFGFRGDAQDPLGSESASGVLLPGRYRFHLKNQELHGRGFGSSPGASADASTYFEVELRLATP